MIPRTLALILAIAVLPSLLFANPSGGTVVSGGADFNSSGNTLTVTTATQQTIINWQDFSIGAGELTHILQPNSSSTTLNRVTGGNVSAIYGTLTSNGGVILINPNGVLIGPGGMVNTQSFLATTYDIPNSAFLSGGDLKLSGDSTSTVVNLGSIRANGGDVFLVARHVSNEGAVSAPAGTVGLAAGTDVTLYNSGEQRVGVRYESGPASGTGVNNTGVIEALRAELKANGNIYSLAVNNGGLIRATGVQDIGGQVWLTGKGGKVQNSGTITAQKGPQGGDVTVTGDTVQLTSTSVICAQGANGGGTVKVGGGAHGQDTTVANATALIVDAGSLIQADALDHGDGGRVTLWADNATDFQGTITARGGSTGGNGGFVEVSGKELLGYHGFVDVTAPLGSTGTLLLDPRNLDIVSSATGTGSNYVFKVSDLQTALQTANVIVQTASSGTQTGDLTVQDSFSWTGNNSLTLSAYHDVTIDTGVTISHASGSGSLFIYADNGANGSGTIIQNGTINLAGSTGSVSFYYNPTAYSSPTIFTGVTAGTGGSFTPYMLINSNGDLNNLAASSSLWGYNFALNKNLDLTGENLSPIGTSSAAAFAGKFDGQNHTLSHLTMNDGTDNYVGLFGYVTGDLANLTLDNISIAGTESANPGSGNTIYVGGVAGYSTGSIANISITGTSSVTASGAGGQGSWNTKINGGAGGNAYAGGLLGAWVPAGSTATITSTSSTATVEAYAGGGGGGSCSTTWVPGTGGDGGTAWAGGLIGYTSGNTGNQVLYSSDTAGTIVAIGGGGGGGGGGDTTGAAGGAGGNAYAGSLVGQNILISFVGDSATTGVPSATAGGGGGAGTATGGGGGGSRNGSGGIDNQASAADGGTGNSDGVQASWSAGNGGTISGGGAGGRSGIGGSGGAYGVAGTSVGSIPGGAGGSTYSGGLFGANTGSTSGGSAPGSGSTSTYNGYPQTAPGETQTSSGSGTPAFSTLITLPSGTTLSIPIAALQPEAPVTTSLGTTSIGAGSRNSSSTALFHSPSSSMTITPVGDLQGGESAILLWGERVLGGSSGTVSYHHSP